MPAVGFEPTISAGERSQTYALDRAATGTGMLVIQFTFKVFHIGLRQVLILQSLESQYYTIINTLRTGDADLCF